MAFNGEMTVNEAKVSLKEMWEKMEKDMSRIADIEIPSLTVQTMIAALCKDRIQTVDFREQDRMKRFYAQRNLSIAEARNDLVKSAAYRAEIEWLSMCIVEFDLRLAYDCTETARINKALGCAA